MTIEVLVEEDAPLLPRVFASRLRCCLQRPGSDAILTGLARDGGLYLPEAWPSFSRDEVAALRGRTYQDIAFEIVRRFTGDDIADRFHRLENGSQ